MEQIPEAEQAHEYIESGGGCCPYCDSEDITAVDQIDPEALTRRATCGACGQSWTDVYALVGVTFPTPKGQPDIEYRNDLTYDDLF